MPDVDALFGVRADTSDATREIRQFGSTARNALENEAGAGARSASSAFEGLQSTIGATRATILGVIGAFAGITAAFGAFAAKGIEFDASIETASQQFKTLIGDADQAKARVQELFEFAARTPFESGEVIKASLALRSAGGAALDTKANLTLLGDAAAATSAPITEVSRWVGRLYADLQAGKPFGEAAQRLTELNVITPQTRMQLETMMKTAKDGRGIWEEFQKSLQRFSGGMQEQAATWQGVTSTLKDNLNALAGTAFKPVFEGLRDLIGQANTFLGSDAVQAWAKDVAVWLGERLTSALAVAREAVARIYTAFQEIAPYAASARNALIALMGAATDIVRAFMALPEPVRVVAGALTVLAAAGPSLADIFEKLGGGALVLGERLSLGERAVALFSGSMDLLIAAMGPGLRAIQTLGPVIDETLGISAIATQAWAGVTVVARNAGLLFGGMLEDLREGFMLIPGVEAAATLATETFSGSLVTLKTAMSAVLAGTVILGSIAAGLAALWQVVEAIQAARAAFAEGKGWIDILTAKDSDNWVRRWLGLAGAVKKAGDVALDAGSQFKSLRDEITGATVAKSVDELQSVFAALQSEGNLTDEALRKIAVRAQELAAQGAVLTPQLSEVVQLFGEWGPRAEQAGGSFAAFSGNTKKGSDALQKFKDNLGDVLTLSDGFGVVVRNLDGAVLEGIKYYVDRGVAIAKVAEMYGLTKAQAEALTEQFKFEQGVVDDTTKSLKGYSGQLQIALPTVTGLTDQMLLLDDGLSDDARTLALNTEAVKQNERTRQTLMAAITKQIPLMSAEQSSLTKALKAEADGDRSTKQFTSDMRALGQSFANVAQLLDGSTSDFFKWAGAVVNAFGTVAGGADQLKNGFNQIFGTDGIAKNFGEGLSKAVTGGLSIVAGIMQGGKGKSLWEDLIGGAIAGSVFGWQGALVGAVVGALEYVMRSDPVKDAADQVGNLMGARISDRLGGQIEADAEQIRTQFLKTLNRPVSDKEFDAALLFARQYAGFLNLDKVIAEAGGVATYGLEKTYKQLGQLIDSLKDGVLTVDQVGAEFDKVFAQLLPAALDKASGLVSQSFVDLQNKAIKANLPTPGMDAFRKQQVGGALGGLSGFFDTGNAALEKEKTLTDKLNDLIVKYRSAKGDDQVKLKKEMDETAAALEKQRLLLNTVTVQSQASASAMANGIVASFGELRRQGVSVADAIAAILPAADGLQKQMERAGLSGGAAFKGLRDMIDMTKDEVAGPAIQAMADLGETVKGLANTGLLTKEDFKGLADQVGQTYGALIAQGKDGSVALKLMQPELQTLWEEQQRLGVTLDAGTQAMLDQAQAAGLVGETQKSAAQQSLDVQNAQLSVLSLMAEKLGVVLPDAVKRLTASFEEGAQQQSDAIANGPTAKLGELETVASGAAAGAFGDLARAIQVAMEAGGGAIDANTLQKLRDLAAQNGITGDAFDALVKRIAAGAADSAASIEKGPLGKVGELDDKLGDVDWSGMKRDGGAATGGISGGLKIVVDDVQTTADKTVLASQKFDEWGKKSSKDGGATGKVIEGIGGVTDGLDTVSTKISGSTADFRTWADKAVADVDRVTRAINGLNFGRSPGGLKELFPFISGATAAFEDFSQTGVAAATRVRTQFDALSLAQASRMAVTLPTSSVIARAAAATQLQPPQPPQSIVYEQHINIDAIDTDSVKKRLEEWTPMMLEHARINTNNAGTILNARVREVRRGRR